MRIVPQSLTACPVASADAPGIRREMGVIARQGLTVVLTPQQVTTLALEWREMLRDAVLSRDEE